MSRFFIFNTSDELNNAYENLPRPNIIICEGQQTITYTPPIHYNFCDILYSDANGNLKVSSEVLPTTNNLTPIALCIVPTNTFGTSKTARWISLKYMDRENPETGSLTAKYFASETPNQYATNFISPAWKLTKDINNDKGKTIYDTSSSTYTVIPTFYDENNKWNINAFGNGYLLSDINGYENTQIVKNNMLNNNITYLTDDLTANNYANGYKTCLRYSTLGTKQGDWYFGALGEFLLMAENFATINSKLQQIYAVYPNNCINGLTSAGYMINERKDFMTSMSIIISSNNSQIISLMKYTDNLCLAMLQY